MDGSMAIYPNVRTVYGYRIIVKVVNGRIINIV